MKKYLLMAVVLAAVVFFYVEYAEAGGTWTTLDMPGAYYTTIHGINGNTKVGCYYSLVTGSHGFSYNGAS